MPVSYDSTRGLAVPETGLKVRNCNERSMCMLLLQLLVRPARPSLVKPGPPQPPGSPQLDVPRSVRRSCVVGERKVSGVWCYDVACKKGKTKAMPYGHPGGPTSGTGPTWHNGDNHNHTHNGTQSQNEAEKKNKKHIYYFAGGSWQSPPSSHHWALVAELTRRLTVDSATAATGRVVVTLVSCPLAPNSPAFVAIPKLRGMYDTLMQEAADKGERAILMGDSSGGNLALSLATWGASGEGRGLAPAAVMAICPATDLRHEEPQMHAVARKDPLQTLGMLQSTARTWYTGSGSMYLKKETTNGSHHHHSSGGRAKPEHGNNGGSTLQEEEHAWTPPEQGAPLTTASDPYISPLLAPLEPLAARNVRVHGVTASHDLLAPEAVLFRERCREAGIDGEWLDWDKQMHCFPLAFRFGLRESKQSVAWMIDVLDKM